MLLYLGIGALLVLGVLWWIGSREIKRSLGDMDEALTRARMALHSGQAIEVIEALERGFLPARSPIDDRERARAVDALAVAALARDRMPAATMSQADRLIAELSRISGRSPPERRRSDPPPGWTELHGAAQEGRIDVMRALLEKGADPNAKTGEGLTPLHLASNTFNLEAVELLLAAKADLSATDSEGWTALDYAAEGGSRPIFERLEALDAPRLIPDPESKHNRELEAGIMADPDNVELHLIYADWLMEQGDPRGEWIMLEHRGEQDQAERLRSQFDARIDRRIAPTWRFGFVDRAVVDDFEVKEQEPSLEWAVRSFLRSASARLLRELIFARVTNSDGLIGYDSMIRVLAEQRLPALRALVAGEFDFPHDCELSWVEVGDLSPVYRNLPNLRSLTLQGGGVVLGRIELPELTSFELRTGTIASDTVRSIAQARWPNLERLVVWFGQETYGVDASIEELAPILEARDLPKLKHLGLMNAEFTDELCEALATAPIAAQLESLSLAMGTLSDEGAAALERAPIRHLKQIDVSECFLSEEGLQRLRRLGPEIVGGGQRPQDEYRYAMVGE